VDKLATHGRKIPGVSWFSTLPQFLLQYFYRDRTNGCLFIVILFLLFLVLLEDFGSDGRG